ncbi:MAG: DoxX family protein [Patescibacteria group bacterium]
MFNKLNACKCSNSWQDAGKLLLRLALGSIFVYHGYAKFVMGNVAVAGFFTSIGIPAAEFFAPLVIWVEMIAGGALILGLCTHWASKLLSVVAVVALFTAHISKGFSVAAGGYEFILLILASSLAILTMGAGKYSIDEYWCKNKTGPSGV